MDIKNNQAVPMHEQFKIIQKDGKQVAQIGAVSYTREALRLNAFASGTDAHAKLIMSALDALEALSTDNNSITDLGYF